MAPYKGPIFPALAVGGFLKENEYHYDSSDYIKANGLILSFLMNNHLDEEKLKPVIKWEERYFFFFVLFYGIRLNKIYIYICILRR